MYIVSDAGQETRRLPILPIEIHENIIDHLYEVDHIDFGATPNWQTLVACTLVCKAWLPRARFHLYRVVYIFSQDRLDGLISMLQHPSHIPSFVQELWALEIVPDQLSPHIIPHFLATKLTKLDLLHIQTRAYAEVPQTLEQGEKIARGVFHFHSSLLMNLSQFRSVSRLELARYRFPSFLDVRRFVGALPGLKEVHLEKVTWETENRNNRPTPHIRTTKWKLFKVTMEDCQSDCLGFWFWIVSGKKRTSRSSTEHIEGASVHPGFSSQEAGRLSDLLAAIPSYHGNLQCQISWEFDSQQKTWRLHCVRAIHKDPMVYLMLRPPRHHAATTNIVFVHSVTLTIMADHGLLADYNWGKLGGFLFQFADLSELKIRLSFDSDVEEAEKEKFTEEFIPIIVEGLGSEKYTLQVEVADVVVYPKT